jgi:hypothetical protein
MDTAKITFFMIVTDPDLVIADYAVRSYAKIGGLSFRLRVYSNWVSSSLRQHYFPRWRSLPFVEMVENEWQTDENKPTDPGLDGPFELYDTIWDRELKKIETAYYATVDADFEILDGSFVTLMVAQLESRPNLVAMATDYSPTVREHYDSYSNEVICLNERWHTWFCIYKRAALRCEVSHAYHQEIMDGPVRRNAWDSGAYFQKALRKNYGFELTVLDPKYQGYFIHYGAFSKNRHINERNVGLYRRLQILRKRGLFDGTNAVTNIIDAGVKKMADLFNRACFGHVDRSKYWPGWRQGS